MKRNLDLYRDILKAMESETSSRSTLNGLPNVDNMTFVYHVRLMWEANLIQVTEFDDHAGDELLPESITHDGHEFLDAVREDTTWNRIKFRALSSAGTVTLELLKATAQLVVKGMLT